MLPPPSKLQVFEKTPPMPHKGRCLCGATTITVNAEPEFNIICHCEDCRRTNGSAFSSQVLAPAASTTIEGSYKMFEVQVPSGRTVTRWFCSGCGSHLMHRSAFTGDDLCVQTGNIDEFTKLPIGMELFVKDRWPAVPAVEGAQQIDGMPV